MPRLKYKEFEKVLKRASLFNFKVVEQKLGKKYAKLFIHNLKKKGKIEKIAKGWYSFNPSPYLLLLILRKSYVGLGSAAFIHGVWGQVPNLEILTPLASKRIKSEKIIAGRKIIIKWIPEKLYFGYELKFFDNRYVRISDLEKTLIDLVYFDYPFNDEILPSLIKKIDKQKLFTYLKLLKKRKLKKFGKVSKVLDRYKL